MDYKYILQLLDRYWKGDTSLEEEDILHIFFSQSGIPAELEQWRPYFDYARRQKQEVRLGDDFDRRVLARVGEEEQRPARRATLRSRLAPLLRAVAVVAVVLTISNIAQMPYSAGTAEQPQEQHKTLGTTAAAAADSITTDSLRQSQAATVVRPQEAEAAQPE